MDRFCLERQKWYAAEFICEEFGPKIRSYSPIRVDNIAPRGNRTFELAFYHANYPEGVRDKTYRLQTIDRNSAFMLARSKEHVPTRLLLIYEISESWLRQHFGAAVVGDPITWLERNA